MAAVAGLLVVTAALPAYAGGERPPKVGRKALPATSGVAAIYPALTDGSRYITRGGRQMVMAAADDCVKGAMLARADRGTGAAYFMVDGKDPYEQGEEDPTVSGFRFASVTDAEEVMEQVRSYVERCSGEHEDSEGHGSSLDRLDDPALGDEAIVLATTHTWPDSDDPGGPGGWHGVDVVVRDGLSISRVQVKRSDAYPDLDRVLALAELSWERLT